MPETKTHCCKIRRPDPTGDTLVATVKQDVESSVQFGNQCIADFVTECLAGNVFATPLGTGTENPVLMESIPGALDLSNRMSPKVDVSLCDSVLLISPLAGG